MSVLSATRSKRYSNFLTFGQSHHRVFGIIAGETAVLGATFFVAEPPFLPIPVADSTALIITGLLTILLAVVLYVLLSGLGHRTYSVKFHSPVHILKCWAAYLAFSVSVIYLGYLLLVNPYSGTLVPKAVDLGIGAVFSTAYAISITSIIYAEDLLSDNETSKSDAVTAFISAADDIREKPESELVDEPDRLIQAGESLLTGLQASDLDGTEELADDLQDWLETFKQRELQGQKKMVGDLPDTTTRFDVWDDRYESFQDVRSELEKIDRPATHRIVLSIRGKKS